MHPTLSFYSVVTPDDFILLKGKMLLLNGLIELYVHHLEKLQKKDEEIKELARSVEQLRSYIGEVRPSQEVEKLSESNKQLQNTVQILTNENNTLHSTAKLLNLRLNAILEIVSIQEAELSRHGDVAGHPEDNQGLLRKWREKVWALMVQLQSQKIVEREVKQKEDAKVI